MSPRRCILPIGIISLVLLLLYVWTLTESVSVTVRVAFGHCLAELYGRTSIVPCPGMVNGALVPYTERPEAGMVTRLLPTAAWGEIEITSPDGYLLPATGPLPAAFQIRARLRRAGVGGLVLRTSSGSGWVFLIDGDARRGAWWTWGDGAPAAPLQGIPLDRPLVGQGQVFVRQLLGSWLGAVALLLATLVVGFLIRLPWGRLVGNQTDNTDIVATHSLSPSLSSILTMRNSDAGRPFRRWVVIPIILFVFALTLYIAIDVLKRLPHVQDSVTYLFQAQTLARGRLAAPAPPLAAADHTAHFAQEFLLVRDGHWFGKYPPGYPTVLAMGVLAGGHWLINPLLSALTIPLVYILARALGRRSVKQYSVGQYSVDQSLTTDPLNTDLLPILLLAVSPFFLVTSGSLMAHPAELFWTTLFMVAWARTWRSGQRRWAAVAGVAFGMLFLTRQFTALLIGLSFGLAWLLITAHRNRSTSPAPLLPFSLSPLLLFLLTAAPFLLTLPTYQGALTGDPLTDPRLLYWPYDRVGFGPGVGEPENVFTYISTANGPAIQWLTDPDQPPRGHSPSRGLYNLDRNLNALETELFGWPALFTLAFIWLAFVLRRPTAADWLLLLTALAVAGGYVIFWHAGIAYGPRYLYAALPALVILTARGASALAAVGGRRPVVVILALLLGYHLLTLPARLDAFRGYNFVSGAPRASVEAAVVRPALVFVAASEGDWWEYGAFFSSNTPWLDGDIVYARDLGAAENDRLRAAFPGRVAYLWQNGVLHPLEP